MSDEKDLRNASPALDAKHPWADLVATAVRFADGTVAHIDLVRAVRSMQDRAYGFDHSMCGSSYCYVPGCMPEAGLSSCPACKRPV